MAEPQRRRITEVQFASEVLLLGLGTSSTHKARAAAKDESGKVTDLGLRFELSQGGLVVEYGRKDVNQRLVRCCEWVPSARVIHVAMEPSE
jgi:hypothetical protein